MSTIHFGPGEDQQTKEASVFHALLDWLEALYSRLLPVLPRVHEWITPLVHGDPIASHGNMMENDAYWCIITEDSWLIGLNADLMWLHISEIWEKKKRGSTLCIWHTSLGTELMEQKNKQAVKFFCILNTCVSPRWQLGFVAPESKKGFWKWTGPDWDFHYLMLDHLSNCNISPRQICSFMLCRF